MPDRDVSAPPGSVWRRLPDLLFRQHTSSGRLAVAVGVGVFIGLTPLYGLHAVLGLAMAWLLRLNVAVTILATQISNPLLAPVLIGASAWLGAAMGGSTADADWYDPTSSLFYMSWLRGGLVLGLTLGAAAGGATFLILSRLRGGRHA